jgi:bifunctional UDP-N-acetylglucosamine pyrophosphorylase/glucosamine-1-phosphate N-acetyltransferase
MVEATQPTRAIVLAGGQGKRMKSNLPKVLHEVLGMPILARLLGTIDLLNLEHIHVVVGHQSEQIKEFLSKLSLHTPVSLHLQEPQLGTGHAVQQVLPSLANFKGDLLITPGDTPLLSLETLAALLSNHRTKEAQVTILTTDLDDPKNYGRIVRAKNGDLLGIVEDKDATPAERAIKEINSAVYCLSYPRVKTGIDNLSNKNKQAEYYLTDVVAWARQEKLTLTSFKADDWREVSGINSRLDLTEANQLLRDQTIRKLSLESGVTVVDPHSTWISPEVKIGQDTIILPGCHLVGNITIGDRCTIGPNTVMEGEVHVGSKTRVVSSHLNDCQVGNKCKVGPYAHLRPATVISDEVKIGNFVEVKKSFLGLHSSVGHLSYIGDATVGNYVNVGAGTIIANYDHATKEKARTTIGNGAATGSNSVLVAPVVLGDESFVGAGTVVTKDVPSGALAVRRVQQENIEGWVDKRKRQSKKVKV